MNLPGLFSTRSITHRAVANWERAQCFTQLRLTQAWLCPGRRFPTDLQSAYWGRLPLFERDERGEVILQTINQLSVVHEILFYQMLCQVESLANQKQTLID